MEQKRRFVQFSFEFIFYDGPIFMGESRKGFEADLSFSQTSTPSLSASVLKLTTYSYLEQKIVKLKLLHSDTGSLSVGMLSGTKSLSELVGLIVLEEIDQFRCCSRYSDCGKSYLPKRCC